MRVCTDAEFNGSEFTCVPAYQDVSFRNAKITDAHFESSQLFIDTDFSNA